MQQYTGGQSVVRALEAHDVKRVFCVAGESYLPVLDALLDYPACEVVTCRQESGAGFGAEAYAQVTGEVGVVMVTRGPGACNASIGVHTAHQSGTPMVMFVGLHAMGDRDRGAFQEFDLPRMFGSLCKWAAVIDRVDRIGEYVARAFHIARSGRAGPVVLGLPEEILSEFCDSRLVQPVHFSAPAVQAEQVTSVLDALSDAKKPVILVGGGGWDDASCAALERFADSSAIPVVASFRRHDLFDHNHMNYAGELGTGPNPALVEAVAEADCVLVLGARLSEITTQGYKLFHNAHQRIIHVYPDREDFGQSGVFPSVAVEAHPAAMAQALAGAFYQGASSDWASWRDRLRAGYEAWTAIEDSGETFPWEGADVTQIFKHLQDHLPSDCIVTTDAGNFSGWCQRYLRYGRPARLCAPISGAMGYAVPAAVAASMACPDRCVVGFCGDGGFMMSTQELATAAHHGATPIIIVFNNGVYGTIKMHQQRDFPDRPSATDLTNPDFVALAQSYGGYAVRVESAEDFPHAFKSARASGKLAVIEIMQDPRQSTTRSVI